MHVVAQKGLTIFNVAEFTKIFSIYLHTIKSLVHNLNYIYFISVQTFDCLEERFDKGVYYNTVIPLLLLQKYCIHETSHHK